MCVPNQVFIFAGVVLCHVTHYLAAGIVHQLYQHSYSANKTQNDPSVTVLTAMPVLYSSWISSCRVVGRFTRDDFYLIGFHLDVFEAPLKAQDTCLLSKSLALREIDSMPLLVRHRRAKGC